MNGGEQGFVPSCDTFLQLLTISPTNLVTSTLRQRRRISLISEISTGSLKIILVNDRPLVNGGDLGQQGRYFTPIIIMDRVFQQNYRIIPIHVIPGFREEY